MSIIDRLSGIGTEENSTKLGVHTFWAALSEFADGFVTKPEIVSYFQLDSTEEEELDWLVGKYTSQPNAEAKAKFVELIHVIFILAEQGAPGYTTNAQIVARINAI